MNLHSQYDMLQSGVPMEIILQRIGGIAADAVEQIPQVSTDYLSDYSQMAIRVLDEYIIRLQTDKIGVLAETITDCYQKLANKKHLIQNIEMNTDTLDIKYVDYSGAEVPRSSLSAGEKQLMVIAILWALAICSKKKLPVIIDTPLSRLDSIHRKALIERYFP